jgi:hypothetical protein
LSAAELRVPRHPSLRLIPGAPEQTDGGRGFGGNWAPIGLGTWQLPAADGHRKGVPQDRHAHGLLASGRAALEELFGGLTDELVAAGALVADVQGGFRWYNDGLLLRQAPAGLPGLW